MSCQEAGHSVRPIGCAIFSADGRVDLKRYGWDPSRDLSEEELGRILGNADTTSVAVNTRLLSLLRNDPASPMRGTEDSQ